MNRRVQEPIRSMIISPSRCGLKPLHIQINIHLIKSRLKQEERG